MPSKTRLTGDKGEEMATRRLRELGYTVLERNYTRSRGEIDIIAEKDGVIYFTEVKTRSESGFARPADNINARKRATIARTANCWFQENGERMCGFLVAEICLKSGEINIFEDTLG